MYARDHLNMNEFILEEFLLRGKRTEKRVVAVRV
jgi:hypothetical protein